MIDRRTRDFALPAARPGTKSPENLSRLATGMQRQNASVLIWVEGDEERPPDSPSARRRGMIVVAHGSGGGTNEGSFIISYPDATDDRAQHLQAISGLLEGMGWAVLASRRERADSGNVNTAWLVHISPSGLKQSLWLAESVGTAQDRSPGTNALIRGLPAAGTRRDCRTREMRDQVEGWVNEGGAGDDLTP